jgi:hypothetical protein
MTKEERRTVFVETISIAKGDCIFLELGLVLPCKRILEFCGEFCYLCYFCRQTTSFLSIGDGALLEVFGLFLMLLKMKNNKGEREKDVRTPCVQT